MWRWLTGNKPLAADGSSTDRRTDDTGDFLTDFLHLPSFDFFGQFSRSANGRFAIAWADGGPHRSRIGRYLLLDEKKVVVEGKMCRPNDGKVSDEGVFVLNDWGAQTLSGTFMAFAADGCVLASKKFDANLFNNGLAPDGHFAVCQTCNAPSDDGNLLTLFDLEAGREINAWRPESGWASTYEFPGHNTISLGYQERGVFSYAFDGTFLDRMRWLAAGLQKGDIFTIETLLVESEREPSQELAAQLLLATTMALAGLRSDDNRSRARVLKSRGLCLEATGEVRQALAAYEEALTLDAKIGVKRRVEQLRKIASP